MVTLEAFVSRGKLKVQARAASPLIERFEWQAAGLVLLVFVAYANAIGSSFHFDDADIFTNPWIVGPGFGLDVFRLDQTRPLTTGEGAGDRSCEVRSNAEPILAQNGTFDVFNALRGAALAPGEIVQSYGTNLASTAATATATPLPASLGGTSVTIGGMVAPLFYAGPGQIDAQVPYELNPGVQYELQVNANGALSSPLPVQIEAFAPGIASASGVVIAQHAADYSPVTEAAPAKPGEYVILHLSGLGATDNAVATGAAATSSPFSHPLVAPALTLGGNAVPIAFAGLAPGAVGLFQINFQVPADAASGDLTLSVSQGGVSSNSGILPVGK